MKTTYYYVNLGLSGISPERLLASMRIMVKEMTANPDFPNPMPALASCTAAADELAAAINAYLLNSGPRELSDRNQALRTAKALTTDLGSYVQAASNGELAKIQSAGCQVRRPNTPIGQLAAPPNADAATTLYPRRLAVRWGAVKGRSGYNLFICIGDPAVETNWRLLDFTTKTRYVADGLKSNDMFYFRVVAVGTAGPSPASDIANAKAA